MMQKKSFVLKTEQLKKRFFLIDCSQQSLVLGRLATEIVKLLKGKDLVEYTPHTCGANTKIILTNAKEIKVTGNKSTDKVYKKYTGYVGGLKETLYKNMKIQDIVVRAVKGMINKGPMRNQLMKRLYVYDGENHPYQGQKPINYKLEK